MEENSPQNSNINSSHDMEPYTIGALAIGISNLWNGWRSREQAAKFEKARIIEKRVADEVAHGRAKEMQKITEDQALRMQAIAFKNHRIDTELNSHFEITNTWYERGGWKNNVRRNETRPMVIFDTILNNNTSDKNDIFAINPMDSLCQAFENQANKYISGGVYVTNIKRGFEAQSSAEAFYNDELFDSPAILVYGKFDGFLRIHAVYGGMTISQYTFDYDNNPKIISYRPEHICLLEIPNSIVLSAIDSEHQGLRNNVIKETLQKELLDLAANFPLLALLDSYFSIHTKLFKPIAGKGEYLDRLEGLNLGIETEGIKTAMKEHQENVRKQINYIQLLRSEHTKDFVNKHN